MEATPPQATPYKGMAITAWIMIGVTCLISLIPGIGFITWLIGIPILLVTLILGIIIITKNGTGQGIFILLVSLIFAPIFISVAPVVTTGGALLAGAVVGDWGTTTTTYAETSTIADTTQADPGTDEPAEEDGASGAATAPEDDLTAPASILTSTH